MNRTIEQWAAINPEDVAYNATTVAVQHLVQSAISDLQELARQLETERAAWSAKRAELLRNHAAELVRRKTAEVQRDELLAATERFNEAYKTWNGGMAHMHFSTSVQPRDYCQLSAVYEKIKEQTK